MWRPTSSSTAWAQARSGKTRVVALNWGIWADVGMAAEAVTGRKPAPVAPAGVPMLDHATHDAQGNRLFTARWHISRWWLDGHRTAAGDALIPGTGYLDMAAQALKAQGETGAWELRDLYFFRPSRWPRARRARSACG